MRIGKIATAALLAGTAHSQVTTLVSSAALGASGNGDSGPAAISRNGRYVAFGSSANDLVAGDGNGKSDVFVRDTWTGATDLASVSSSGLQGNGDSSYPALSSDGRFVAFESSATNLAPGDVNSVSDIYLRDRVVGTTKLISVTLGGTTNLVEMSSRPDVSDDGRIVVFESAAPDLVPGDTNSMPDLFARDVLLGTTTRISLTATGGEGMHTGSIFPIFDAELSPDGRWVAFSTFFQIVASDTNVVPDVYLRDLSTGTVELMSRGASPAAVTGYGTALSDDGRYVAFVTLANGVVASDTNGSSDVYLRDRLLGLTTCASVDLAGLPLGADSREPALSSDGSVLAFTTLSNALDPLDDNGVLDVYLREPGSAARVSVDEFGAAANDRSHGPTISGNGQLVAFDSTASDLVSTDFNGLSDAFVRDVAPCPGLQRYCTAGTSFHGCAATIGASGSPSASNPCSFTLSVTGVEGQRQGTLFYGVSGAVAFAWGPTSSFLCVKSPTQRTGVQSSGGTLVQCDGSFALDFCSFVAGHPGALGTPFSAGDFVWVQAWYRDPGTFKSTALSDALRFTLCP